MKFEFLQKGLNFAKEELKFRRVRPMIKKLSTERYEKRRSKLFGLHVLKKLCKNTGNKVLPHNVYTGPKNFSLNYFRGISGSRLLIRTDIQDTHGSHTYSKWDSMPRLNVDLAKSGSDHERQIKEFMAASLKADPKIVFIVHKVPPIENYHMSIRFEGVLGEGGFVDILVSKVYPSGHKDFRSNMHQSMRFSIKPNQHIDRELTDFHRTQLENDAFLRARGGESHNVFTFSPHLQNKLFDMADRMVRCAKAANTKHFEASCVTYKTDPETPEYFDFLLGCGFETDL